MTDELVTMTRAEFNDLIDSLAHKSAEMTIAEVERVAADMNRQWTTALAGFRESILAEVRAAGTYKEIVRDRNDKIIGIVDRPLAAQP